MPPLSLYDAAYDDAMNDVAAAVIIAKRTKWTLDTRHFLSELKKLKEARRVKAL